MPLGRLARVDSRRQKALEKLGIASVWDLLHHYPSRHEDRRAFLPIARARPGGAVTVSGEVLSVRGRATRRGVSMVEALISDGGGTLSAVWFHQPYLVDSIRPGARIFLYGEVKPAYRGRSGWRGAGVQMIAPEFEVDAAEAGEEPARAGEVSLHLGRLVPIYPTTRGIGQRFLRRLVHAALAALPTSLPDRGAYAAAAPRSLPLPRALRDIHFPPDAAALARARDRLAREEYFRFATGIIRRRGLFRGAGCPCFQVTPELDAKIRTVFPFTLTADQDRAVAEIAADLQGPVAMYRLLQGDVGTGKTAVALYALLVAVRNRHQGALMAPTEVLASQHHRTISRLLAPHPAVGVALLTGALAATEKRRVQEAMARGHAHITIGTHALIQEAVRFHRLGVAVVDEQHRFGVRERAALRRKGDHPHLLVMTATPIPRSLCLTAYGDLDLSLLRERPPGRRPVKTVLVTPGRRAGAMEFIRRELAAGRQAYFVYPLIDESEALAVPAAVAAHRKLSREVFPEFSVGLVHGRMAPEEKEERLSRFRDGADQVLVATVVVEVGIDVPNASVLFIEDASRFGLAQLHQLRGRVGRGPHPSHCLVGVAEARGDSGSRLKAFAATEDGFRIAEEDLRRRGPGDFLGVRQAGWPAFALGNPILDPERFLEVRALAERFWSEPRNRERFPEWRTGAAGEEEGENGGAAGATGLD